FVVSFETIEHVTQDVLLMTELINSLKRGGFLFLSAPNENVCSYSKNSYKFHIKHYTFEEITSLIKSHSNLELITWYGNGAYEFKNGLKTGDRHSDEMHLKEKREDSHLTFIIKKN